MALKKFILRTRRKPVTVIVPLITKEPVEIFITGYDPASPKTEYFSRKILVDGTDKVEFGCPQSPRKLKIIIWSTGDKKFTIPQIQVEPLSLSTRNFTEDVKPDIRLIENFSRRAGRLPARRTYSAKGAKFKIQYLPVILRDDGTEHPTPARIHTSLPLIQVSKKHFDKMTVPQRVAILTHEYSHNFINIDQDNEMEADDNMVSLYEELGYPKLEAVYAFANIMSDTDTNYNRVGNIINSL
jgi:hypothetical protein